MIDKIKDKMIEEFDEKLSYQIAEQIDQNQNKVYGPKREEEIKEEEILVEKVNSFYI